MALHPVVVRAIYQGRAGGQQVVNIHDYAIEETPPLTTITDEEMQGLANALSSQWEANVLPLLSEDYTFQELKVLLAPDYVVTTVANPHRSFLLPTKQYFGQTGIGSSGGKVGDRLPLNDAVTMRKITSIASRSGRGSTRFGPTVEADQANGELTPAALLAWQAAATLFVLAEGPFAPSAKTFLLSVWGPGELALPLGQHPVDPAGLFRVLSAPIKRLLRTQLSRKPKF